MSTNVMTIVLYVLLVLAVLGGIGAVAYFTSGFTTDFQTFYLRYNEESIMESQSGMEFLDTIPYEFEVKYTFSSVSKKASGYYVQVVPCITDNDFSFLVDGEPHQYSELTDLTKCFDITSKKDSFVVSGNYQMQSVLERYFEGSTIEIVDEIMELHDYYTIIVSSYNKKASVQVSFHGIDAGGDFRIEPNPIVF